MERLRQKTSSVSAERDECNSEAAVLAKVGVHPWRQYRLHRHLVALDSCVGEMGNTLLTW